MSRLSATRSAEENSIPLCALRNRLTESYWASASQAPIRSCISEQWPNIAFRPYEFSKRNLRAVQTAATSLTTRRYSRQRYVRLGGTGAGDLLSRTAQKIGNIDIQSTGQKSHCVNSKLSISQCFVLIKQSDSPGPYQF